MSDEPTGQKTDKRNSRIRDELRTIAFRLREMQRLQSMRVEQENRRLASDGLEPVLEADFFKRMERPREVSRTSISRLVEKLGDIEVDQFTQVTLLDGTVIEGRAGPIDFDPLEKLRVELTSNDTDVRYELRSSREDERWTPIRVRKYKQGDEDWFALAQASNVSIGSPD